MEEFKRIIQKRNLILKGSILVCIILSIMFYVIPIEKTYEIGISFQLGICIGILFLGLLGIYKYSKALKDEQMLKKLYIEEHDERKMMIKQKVGQSSLITIVLSLAIITCVSAYMNMLVTKTLICVIYGILFITLIFKIYYSKKY